MEIFPSVSLDKIGAVINPSGSRRQERTRRHAIARPVQTRKQPPREARPATIWPAKPKASPVWSARAAARPSLSTQASSAGRQYRAENGESATGRRESGHYTD